MSGRIFNSAPHHNVIDLTLSEPSISATGDQALKRSTQPVDLTVSHRKDSRPADASDHMHAIASLQSLEPFHTTTNEPGTLLHGAPKHRRSRISANFHDAKRPHFSTVRESHRKFKGSQPIRLMCSDNGSKDGMRTGETRPVKPFPFMDFPPEIRNTVYRYLLTTPNSPIEFEGLSGRNGHKHRAQWAKCTSTKARRKHKKLFLEILGVCRRIHDEASGIIYGCNVFKYRNNPGVGPRSVVLPTRHLQLLKHIKISVISRQPLDKQHDWVAGFIKELLKEEIKLESFELTWFGWERLKLTRSGAVCQALQLLKVERQFVVVVTGEARMEKEMQEQLEQTLLPRKVEIRRPVKAVTGDELSEDEAP